MAQIRVLESSVRDRIAAGEVITRPSSVIKELIENSIDARASRIDVEITGGGKERCLVNDDGIGMARDDAELALARYATSKILSIDDIERIQTYGFRGEALASIAQVSRFEMETSNGMIGTKVIAEAGAIKSVLDSERPRGTRVRVADIFFNLPARLKFLKSAEWERRLVLGLVRTYALIFPRIAFYLKEADRDLLGVPRADSILQRTRMLFAKAVTDQLVEIDFELGSTRVNGVVSRPGLAVTHKLAYLYVNSRPVRYPRLFRAIVETCGDPHYPPAFLIDIHVDPQLVDVNIHPAKSEVRLKEERYVLDLMLQVIKRSRHTIPARVEYDFPAQGSAGEQIRGHFVQDTVLDTAVRYHTEAGRPAEEFWQLHETYILAQTKSGMIIVDQHVAHERIIYEAVMKGRVQSQRLLFPITIELTPEEHRVYEKTKHMLSEMGVEFKEFSQRTLVIDGLPADVRVNRDEIAGMFNELNALGDLIKEKGEIARVIACRGAIKAGQRLSSAEMQALIDRLFATENPYICPHGRPIVLRWTIEELAHKFGRS